jgi:DNA-binding winged helix-turn-helix (wHTH) protein
VPVHLTATEFDLLVCLARQPGAVLSREKLLLDVWGYRDGSGARTVDSHIRALRRKLGSDVIRTVFAVGYALDETTAGSSSGLGAHEAPDRAATDPAAEDPVAEEPVAADPVAGDRAAGST